MRSQIEDRKLNKLEFCASKLPVETLRHSSLDAAQYG